MMGLIYNNEVNIQVGCHIKIVAMSYGLYGCHLNGISQITRFPACNDSMRYFITFQILTDLVYQLYAMSYNQNFNISTVLNAPCLDIADNR